MKQVIRVWAGLTGCLWGLAVSNGALYAVPPTWDIVAPGAVVERVSERFIFTEGPAVDKWGNVFFTDQPNNKIWKWSALDGQLTVFHDAPGRSNGLYFDRAGDLLACADQDNELWVFDMQGAYRVLVKDYQGKKLNGPNDLWEDLQGGIYFTDPFYKRPYWQRGPMEQDGQHVYYLSPDRQTVTRVIDDLKQPNGIVGTPDGKNLYVADIRDQKTYRYDIAGPGMLAHKTLFAPMGSDGMTLDNQGNLYLTGRGVTVFNAAGEQIKHIPIDSGWTANVCFGGADRDLLFITAKESLYTLKMRVKAVR
jgi:gluconolactonase